MYILRLQIGFLLVFTCSIYLLAQPRKSASVEEQGFSHLLTKANIFHQQAQYDSSRIYLLRAQKILPRIKSPELRTNFYLQFGNYYQYSLQRFDSALVHYYEALKQTSQVPKTRKRLEVMERLAYGHYTWAEHEAALKWCTRCIELADSLKHVSIQARCMQLLGTLSAEYNKDTIQLIAYRRRALDLCLTARDTASLPRAYHYMALAFNQVGKHHLSIIYNDSARYWANKLHDFRHRSEILLWQGLSLYELKEYTRALEKLNSALPYFETTRDTFRIIHTKHEIGKILLAQKQYSTVLALLDELTPFVARKNALYEWSVQYELQYQTYRAMGNYPLALAYFERFYAIKDSIARKANIEALAGVEAHFQLRDKQKTIDTQQSELQLRKQLNWMYLLGLSLALLLAGSLFFLFLRVQKARREIVRQRDIVERQKNELEQLDQLKSRFFTNVSHELRTPLTLILGPLSSMLSSGQLSPAHTKLARLANQHGQHLLKLVNDILDLSKLESNKLETHPVSVSLQPFLLQIVEAFESHAAELGIKLFVDYKAEKRLQLKFDAEKVTTILSNLLSNALKFTPPRSNGQITLIAEDLGDRIRFSVQDTGRGIHPNDLPFIFDRFYQTKQSSAPAEGGTGIGLALCREFAALLEGEIYAESPPPGATAGAVFHLELPLKEVEQFIPKEALSRSTQKKPDSGLAPVSGEIPPNSAANQPPYILVVEDNPGMREYLLAILSNDYQVKTAVNGQKALDMLSNTEGNPSIAQRLPDLIISDMMMPVMNGVELLKILKNTPHFRAIPVIMLTARIDFQDKLSALRAGVDDHLNKPFEEQELLARVKNLLHYATLRKTDHNAASTSEPPQLNDADAAWLNELEQHVEAHMGDVRFSTAYLAELMNLSTRQLQRKLKETIGLSVNHYVQEIRLQRGRELLESGNFLIKDAAAKVGFKDANYFSTLYKERFGKLEIG